MKPPYEMGERVNRVRLDWIEGSCARQLRPEPPSRSHRARRESPHMPYNRVVSLEIAALCRTEPDREIKILASDIDSRPRDQRETIAALCSSPGGRGRDASLALIQHIAGFLRRAQHDPSAVFSPPA
jgi:hypothetical protein